MICILSMVSFTLRQQSWVVTAEIIGPANTKIFTNWPFREKKYPSPALPNNSVRNLNSKISDTKRNNNFDTFWQDSSNQYPVAMVPLVDQWTTAVTEVYNSDSSYSLMLGVFLGAYPGLPWQFLPIFKPDSQAFPLIPWVTWYPSNYIILPKVTGVTFC